MSEYVFHKPGKSPEAVTEDSSLMGVAYLRDRIIETGLLPRSSMGFIGADKATCVLVVSMAVSESTFVSRFRKAIKNMKMEADIQISGVPVIHHFPGHPFPNSFSEHYTPVAVDFGKALQQNPVESILQAPPRPSASYASTPQTSVTL